MGREHVLVEDGGDGGAMLREHRHGGLDDLDLLGRERHDDLCLSIVCVCVCVCQAKMQ